MEKRTSDDHAIELYELHLTRLEIFVRAYRLIPFVIAWSTPKKIRNVQPSDMHTTKPYSPLSQSVAVPRCVLGPK